MRPSHRCQPILAVAFALSWSATVACAADRVPPANTGAEQVQPSLIQRVSHVLFQAGPAHVAGGAGVVQYGMFSPHYALWQSPDLYAPDFRCRPTPWAPHGYGWPKKTSCVRMDYAPYGVKASMSGHGPALWPRSFRDPCCDCGPGEHCGICGQHIQYAPQP